MDPLADVRLAARALHAEALAATGGDRAASRLIAEVARMHDLAIDVVEPGTRFGPGVSGNFDRIGLLISVVSSLPGDERSFVIAHEYGHWRLHDHPVSEVRDTPAALGGSEGGVTAALGYSPRERKEVQADVFGTEFLCPSDWLRGELLDGRRPSEVAARLGVPERLVVTQAVRALLLPALRPPRVRGPSPPHDPDPSQRTAAEWRGGPLLVEAGPGTGKTRTLVERVMNLVARGVPASSMLALTFSNRAASELRERIAARVPGSTGMWIGTFHAFGREVLAQNHEACHLPADPVVLDLAGGLDLLERHLADLPLRSFQNLFEPAYELLPVLRMISRCKDEMVTPATWAAFAREARSAALDDDEAVETAERAVEFGEIYARYDDLLRLEGALDFGDLVMRSTDLVERDPAVRAALQATYPCILVDEYQDVNRAGARMLQALHRPDGHLWVVGDERQSIYRFRGAAPGNVGRFPSDFGGEVRPLEWNYRSGEPVVRVFGAFAATMGLAGTSRWRAKRGAVGSVAQGHAPTIAGEAAIIARAVARVAKAGVALEDQVILARSHLSLARITSALGAHDVPTEYLGDLFERPEIRDLLSLVAIDAEPGGVGLLRVAQLPPYGATREDALTVIHAARARRASVRETLASCDGMPGLSPAGRAGLARLSSELDGISRKASAYVLLTQWLFERGGYLRDLISRDDGAARAKLTAIYHLLKACAPTLTTPGGARAGFLARIRRMQALEQDRETRRVAPEAEADGRVKVMTIHASKGLEFGAVHLPFVATRYMPQQRRGAKILPPQALSELVMSSTDHDAEEMALFFVALSRARDHLSVTRSERYTDRQRCTPSKYLSSIGSLCPPQVHPDPVELGGEPSPRTPQPRRAVYHQGELELYGKCPAAYRYEVVDALEGDAQSSGYLRFHVCVYASIAAMGRDAAAGIAPTVAAGLDRLAEVWSRSGPIGHAFEPYYRATADRMVTDMVGVIATEDAVGYPSEEWVVGVGRDVRVSVRPDRVVELADGSILVQRVRTGRWTKSEAEKPVYALLSVGAAERFPDRRVRLQTLYLGEGRVDVPRTDKVAEQLAGYADLVAGIEAGRFPADPEARRCAGCQAFFACGA